MRLAYACNGLRMITPPNHMRRHTSTDDWITPKALIDRLGPFDLDPCACVPQPWPCAAAQFTAEDNGLMRPWHGMVWLNPPYGQATGAWLNRISLHGKGIALVFARTDTKHFFRYVWPHATALLFLRGRITFFRPDGTHPPFGHNSGGPSVLIAYGDTAAGRMLANRRLGAFIWNKL